MPAAMAAHVDAAVAAARQPSALARYAGWAETRLLHALGDALQAQMPELMQLVTKESGKPLNGLAGISAGMEVGGAIARTHVTADLSPPVEVVQDNEVPASRCIACRSAWSGLITPWNWPPLIAIWHVIPALRAGNTVVIKPSEFTPLATLRFVELANGILPKGVLNIVTGGGGWGGDDGAPGHRQDRVPGSTETGRRIMQGAAGNLKRLTLELGGNDAGIVLPDVDVDAIAPKLFAAMLPQQRPDLRLPEAAVRA